MKSAQDVGDAVGKVVGCTRRETLVGALLTTCAVIGGFYWHATAWLGLFGALLLPLLLASHTTRWVLAVLPRARRWSVAWLLLALFSLSGMVITAFAYPCWMARFDIHALTPMQLQAAIGAWLLFTLAGPLWRAQSASHTLALAQLEQAALAAELKALQAQVEPHFLYNTLANTRYLARTEPARAVEMLDHLIAYLRSALPDLRRELSSVARECELVEHYLAIMAIRFGTRLRYHIDCAPDIADVPIPPLLLLSLAENAVVHGVEPAPGLVCITLTARVQSDELRIAVCDDGAGIASGGIGVGVGLRNLTARLAAIYGDAARFELRALPCGAEATLHLPLKATGCRPVF